VEQAWKQGTVVPQIELPDPYGSESSFSEQLWLRVYSAAANGRVRKKELSFSGIPRPPGCYGNYRCGETSFVARFESPYA
jgi:hypothetical protein